MKKYDWSNLQPKAPAAFSDILTHDDSLFLVGGQAVNLWALYYYERTAELAPFVSCDADILGNRKTLSKLASAAGVEPHFFSLTPPTNEVGVMIVRNSSGEELPIEVLSHVHGISNEELLNPEYTIAFGEDNGTVRVPGPIGLLQAKIANVADIQQKGRQDDRHVLILSKLMPCYLEDLRLAVCDGRLTERKMINLLERLLDVVATPKACKVLGKLSVNAELMFAELSATDSSKLHSFITKRLPRFFS